MLNLFSGKLNRRQFLTRLAATIILVTIFTFFQKFIDQSYTSEEFKTLIMIANLVFDLAVIIYAISLYARRIDDAGYSRYLTFAAIIPIANLIVLVLCIFAPSSEKGEPSLKQPTSEVPAVNNSIEERYNQVIFNQQSKPHPDFFNFLSRNKNLIVIIVLVAVIIIWAGVQIYLFYFQQQVLPQLLYSSTK